MYLNVTYSRPCRTQRGLEVDTRGSFGIRIFAPAGLLPPDIVIGVVILHLHDTLITVLINLDIAIVFVHSVTFLGLRRVHFSFSTCLLSLSHHVTNHPSISIT